MKASYSCLLAIIFSKSLLAQSIPTTIGARSAGIAYASSNLKDEWSLFNNAGGIAANKSASTSFAYEALPALTGANRMAAVFNLPIKPITLSVGAFRFGDELYNQHVVCAGIGSEIGNTSLGAKASYIQYRAAEGFGTQTTYGIDVGGITQITPDLSVGAYIINLTQSKFKGNTQEHLPTRLVTGVGFKPDASVLIVTEIDKDIIYKLTWRTGIEYNVEEKIFFRTGYNLNPQAGFFGLGFKKKNLKIDYALAYNVVNGMAHQASAVYLLTAKAKE